VAHIVEVLLRVDQLGEGGDPVVGQEVVVCGGVEAGTGPADVVGACGHVVVAVSPGAGIW
jgi:hypothetical protein